jgi:hypothetical protein
MTESHKLRVFLCHASQDKPVVRELYQRLLAEGWIDPWLDEEKLLPGQDWDMEIEKAVEAAEVVIVCLSNNSVSKEGYIQKELRFVLDIALEKPEGTIFVVPLRLDDCELPRRLSSWHYVNYFPPEQRDRAYQLLLKSLDFRFNQLKSKDNGSKSGNSNAAAIPTIEEREPSRKASFGHLIVDSLLSKGSGEANVGGSVLQILYFSLAGLDALGPSNDVNEILLGVFAFLAGIAVLFKKQIPATVIFKISLIVYLLTFGFGYRIDDLTPFAFYGVGIAALVSGGVLVLTVQIPKKPVFYSSISFALFLFLVCFYEIGINVENFPPVIGEVDTLILITSIVTSVLLVRDL